MLQRATGGCHADRIDPCRRPPLGGHHRAHTPREVADLLTVAASEVRSWRLSPDTLARPHVRLLVAAVDAGLHPDPVAGPSTQDQLVEWRRNRGMKSLSALAAQLGVSRQALNTWGRTRRTPPWVPLACAGLDTQDGRSIT